MQIAQFPGRGGQLSAGVAYRPDEFGDCCQRLGDCTDYGKARGRDGKRIHRSRLAAVVMRGNVCRWPVRITVVPTDFRPW